MKQFLTPPPHIVLNYDVIQRSLHALRHRQIKIRQYFIFTRFQGKPPNLKTFNISGYTVLPLDTIQPAPGYN